MLIPILVIAAAFISGWVIALLTEIWVGSTKKTEKESNRKSPTTFKQKFSFWSFILLLFTPLTQPGSLTPAPRQTSDSARIRQSNESNDEEFCGSVG